MTRKYWEIRETRQLPHLLPRNTQPGRDVDGVFGDYFEAVAFDSAWGNLSSVVQNGLGGTGGADYFAIDNIVVGRSAALPEPGTLSLLGLGSVYLCRRRGSKHT